MKRRRINELYVGMKIEHMFRGQMRSPEFDWYATVMEIPEDSDEIRVQITGGKSGVWMENWNRAITENGLLKREYLEIKVDH